MSQVNDPVMGFVVGSGIKWKTADYSRMTKATALEVREKPRLVADRLLRQLLRGLGTEGLLDQLPSDLA
jgi:hypothetical protein